MATVAMTEARASDHHDPEKIGPVPNENRMTADDTSDDGSGHVQDGVKTVEAVTQIWSRKMLWLTFATLVDPPSKFVRSCRT